MLYTISTSTLSLIDVDLITHTDVVLFWQDGVIITVNNNPILQQILNKTQLCYALDNDILARGLSGLVDKRVHIIDMLAIVHLTENYYPQIKQ